MPLTMRATGLSSPVDKGRVDFSLVAACEPALPMRSPAARASERRSLRR
jgi:hypothetical protein